MLELVQKSNSAVVKEWTISNTTLEQVFLTLCESASTNYAGSDAENDLHAAAELVGGHRALHAGEGAAVGARHGAARRGMARQG